MAEETQAGGMTIVDDGDTVSAFRGDAPPAEPEPVETPAAEPEPKEADEPEPEPKEAATDERDDQGRFKPKAKDKKPPVERRQESIQAKIDRARYELGQEERRLAQIRTERQRAETPPPAQPIAATTGDEPPPFDQFAEDYLKQHPDTKKYEVIVDAYQKLNNAFLLKQFERKQAESEETRQVQSDIAAHAARMEQLAEKNPNIQAEIQSLDKYLEQRGVRAFPKPMQFAILRSPKSEQIVQDLTQHPEIAFQVALDTHELPMTPATVKMVRTVLESRLSSSGSPAPTSGPGKPPQQSRSNPPPKPVGSSPIASATSESDEPTYDQMLERVTKNLHRR